MNSQINLLRKTLEGLANKGAVKSNYGSNSNLIEPTYQNQAQEVAKMLLDEFPEENSDHMKAYRALEFLVRYLDDADFETGYHVDDYTISEQLLRLRGEIGEKATDDILDRLEVDETETRFSSYQGMTQTEIYDPVSKITRSVSDPSDLQMYTENTAREVLEFPLNG